MIIGDKVKKFTTKIYVLVTIIILIISSFILSFFNIYQLKKLEQNNILKLVNVSQKIYIDDETTNKIENIKYILKQFGITVDKVKKQNFNDYVLKIENKKTQKKMLNSQYNSFIYNTKMLYYITQDDDNIIIMHKKINIKKIIIRDILLCFFITFNGSIIIYFFFKKYIKNNIILPLNHLVQQIPKIKQKDQNITLKDYNLEEINHIFKEVIKIKKDLESMDNKLKIEKDKLDYILDSMSEGFILVDKNKNVFAINKTAKKILNSSKNNLGENMLYYTQNIKFIENIDKVLNTSQKKIFDFKTEDRKIYSIHITKIKKGIIEKGKSGAIILMIDVTAEKMAEKLKQEFFSNVSHELKTPITSIQGYTELLYNDFANSKQQEKEFLKTIQKEINNVTNLINNILTISKLENKEIEIDKSEINIKTVVDEIISSTKPLCIERNIKVSNNCENVIMFVDYKKIHQLLNNLIVNAIKYNKDNGFVNINCFEDDKYINLTVKDSGIGIPVEDRNRIFERFYRVEKGRSKETGGTGLGLSIVKHIVKYYNGKIKVKSKEGFGSEFIIKIPIN